MRPQDALDIAEGMSGGEGAQMALAAEMCGMDYSDFCDSLCCDYDAELLSEIGRNQRERAVEGRSYLKGEEKKLAKIGIAVDKRNDGCHWMLFKGKDRAGDYWPTTGRWNLAGNKGRGFDALRKALK